MTDPLHFSYISSDISIDNSIENNKLDIIAIESKNK